MYVVPLNIKFDELIQIVALFYITLIFWELTYVLDSFSEIQFYHIIEINS